MLTETVLYIVSCQNLSYVDDFQNNGRKKIIVIPGLNEQNAWLAISLNKADMNPSGYHAAPCCGCRFGYSEWLYPGMPRHITVFQ